MPTLRLLSDFSFRQNATQLKSKLQSFDIKMPLTIRADYLLSNFPLEKIAMNPSQLGFANVIHPPQLGERPLDIYSRLLGERIIFLRGELT